jgi:aryl-alcohol dehydrogenase-like predicted oxidoreductase
MRRNVLPGTRLELSTVGISAAGGGTADPARWKTTVAHARNAGVNLFDLTGVPSDREDYFRQFLAESREPLAVVVGRSAGRLLDGRGTPSRGPPIPDEEELTEALERSVGAKNGEDPSTISVLVQWESTPGSAEVDPPMIAALRRLGRTGVIQAWGIDATRSPAETAWTGGNPDFESQPMSLLQRPASAGEHWEGFPLLARDPLNAGRLDGSRFDMSASRLSLGQRPLPVVDLRDEFAPVLRLGPLTRRGQRTLPQAALRYVIDVIGAISALVPLPDARRLDEILAFESSPPLDGQDLELIGGLPRMPPSVGRPAPFSSLGR